MQVFIPRPVGALCRFLFTAVLKALPSLPSFIAQVFMCTCMYYIFFILSSIDGRLDSFHVLAVLNNAAVSISPVQSLSCVQLFATP